LPFPVAYRTFFNLQVLGYTRIIDQDVDLETPGFGMREVVFGGVYYVGWTVGGTHVGLDYEGLYTVFGGEGLGKFVAGCGGGVGCVVQNYGGAF
jgi:hypothetical protein